MFSTPIYSIMVKVWACISVVSSITSLPAGISYGIKEGINAKAKIKEQALREVSSKSCVVVYSGNDEKSYFGAIYMCPSKEDKPTEDGEEDVERSSIYYLEDEDAFNKLDGSKPSSKLFRKISKLEKKKGGVEDKYYLLITFEDNKEEKRLPTDSSARWDSFGDFITSSDSEDLSSETLG